MPNLYAFHNSRERAFREPFGAIPAGGGVTLRLYLWGPAAGRADAVLRTWNGDENYYSGSSRWEYGTRVFTFRIKAPSEPCVLWYNFRVTVDGRLRYVGAEDGVLRSGGSVLTSDVPHDFRITVYDPAFKTPEDLCGRIAYQVFPDRFRRGLYPGVSEGIAHHESFGRRVTVKEWDEEVDYLPRGDEKYYSPQDYYLGNFQGVIDGIPYLKSLGVGLLYMNPIFESAYNHRYSISDYMRVDPLLGTEHDFTRMVNALHENGIKLILDGVFSHTGDDSIYFDRYGNYGGGAWNDPLSPYREWYDFDPKYKHGFRCWWDFETLPEVEELTPSYMEFVGRVLEKWLSLGADGFRLDVADELPDEFIKYLRKKLKSISPDALLIGEVWEDAALKEDGYGNRREYVNGYELDGVMDYPFRDAVMDFLLGRSDSCGLKAALGAQLEGYPKCFMRAQLGMLGSHDTERALSVLEGCPVKDALPRVGQAKWTPSAEAASKGTRLMKLASALQFSMPFMPCVYYGDEAGLTGLADPFSRRPYPWGREDAELTEHYRRISAARSASAALRAGSTAFASPVPDVFVIARTGEGEALTAVNRSAKDITVTLYPEDFLEGEKAPALSGSFTDALTGVTKEAEGAVTLTLPAFSCMILSSK